MLGAGFGGLYLQMLLNWCVVTYVRQAEGVFRQVGIGDR